MPEIKGPFCMYTKAHFPQFFCFEKCQAVTKEQRTMSYTPYLDSQHDILPHLQKHILKINSIVNYAHFQCMLQ